MELVNLKIRRYPNLIKGIVIKRGLQWMLLKENVVDYVLDGYLFINHDYIQQVFEYPHDILDYKVLALKNNFQLSLPNLNNYSDFLNHLRDRHLLIAIGRNRQQTILVGYVRAVNEKSIILAPIGVELQELPAIRIDYKKIRYISIMSDYLISISNYLCKNRSINVL